MEQWREIKGFEGRYEVSDHGRVRSLPHYTNTKGGVMRLSPGRVLSPCLSPNGRLKVHLSKPSGAIWANLARLVAFAFCDGYFDGAQVNHKDENPQNNYASNLEWCTASFNCKYGHRNDRMIEMRRKSVAQFSLDGILLNVFQTMNGAARLTGISAAHICDTCKGKRTQAGGFKWAYA